MAQAETDERLDAQLVTDLVDRRGCLWVVWRCIAAFPTIARREWRRAGDSRD
jgi:hypothetical protein